MKMLRSLLALFISAGVILRPSSAAEPEEPLYDVLFEKPLVLDGSLKKPKRKSVAVKGPWIVTVGSASRKMAKTVVDCRGLVLCPGFIDIHTHADTTLSKNPAALPFLRQGVTTVVAGNCGSSPLAIGRHLSEVEKLGPAVNYLSLIGYNDIRKCVQGYSPSKLDALEISLCKGIVRLAMNEGAFGLSYGLRYTPGNYATVEEMVGLGTVVASLNGVCTFHMRNEEEGIVDSVKEVCQVALGSHCKCEISHVKCMGTPQHGLSLDVIRLVEEAQKAGGRILCDMYPYTASGTGLMVLMPPETEFTRKDLSDPEKVKALIPKVAAHIESRGGPDKIVITSCEDTSLNNKSLTQACHSGQSPAELVIDLVRKYSKTGGATALYHCMDEKDVVAFLKCPWILIGSDSAGGGSHPRGAGTFPRILGSYVRDQEILDLRTAIHKMTQGSADMLGLSDRGRIAEGARADLVLFDPERVAEKATWENPWAPAVGISFVMVNGVMAMKDGQVTGLKGGEVLRRQQSASPGADQNDLEARQWETLLRESEKLEGDWDQIEE